MSVYCSSQLYSINLHFEGCIDGFNLKCPSCWKVLSFLEVGGKKVTMSRVCRPCARKKSAQLLKNWVCELVKIETNF